MALTERPGPYIWVTWLTKLMSGENQCQWSSWFRAHYKYDKLPSNFNMTQWQAEHNELLHQRVNELEAEGFTVSIEDENSFILTGKDGITKVSGKPDILAIRGDQVIVEDCKTGTPKKSDHMQVLIYMLVLSMVDQRCKGKQLSGRLIYKNIPPVDFLPEYLDTDFIELFRSTVGTVSAANPARNVPSFRECQFCDIPSTCCANRVEEQPAAIAAIEHDLF